MAITSATGKPADAARVRKGNNTYGYLHVWNGVETGDPATDIVFGKIMRDGKTFGEITPARINERDINEFGYAPTKISDGVQTSDFTITFQGNAIEAAMACRSIPVNAQFAIDHSTSLSNFGAIIQYSMDDAGDIEACNAIFCVGTKELPMVGNEAGGEVDQTINFYGDAYIAYSCPKGYVWNLETWYEGSGVVNPDAGGTTVTLGLGNGSGVVYAASMAKKINPSATGYKQYIPLILIVETGSTTPRVMADAEITSFNVATGVVTFANALLNTDKLHIPWVAAAANLVDTVTDGPYEDWRDYYGY